MKARIQTLTIFEYLTLLIVNNGTNYCVAPKECKRNALLFFYGNGENVYIFHNYTYAKNSKRSFFILIF